MPQNDSNAYDDDHVLTEYVWWNYIHLLSAFEKKVDLAVAKRARFAWNKDPGVLRQLREEHAWAYAADIEEALRNGPERFRRNARERVLKENPDAIRVTRCPACRRIASTPRDRVCPWCGNAW